MKHALSNVNLTERAADCAVCGPEVNVRIRLRERGTVYVACRRSDRGAAYSSTRHRRRRYGLTPEEYGALLNAQDGHCAICRGQMGEPQVDHDHATGKVRGLLCRPCNLGLGMFRDSQEALARAQEYLSRN